MLDRGDNAVLAAPKVNFFIDLERLKLPHSPFVAHIADNYAQEAADADRAELAAALQERGTTGAKKEEIISAFEKERTKLTILRGKLEEWDPAGTDEWTDGQSVHHDPPPRPNLAGFTTENLAGAPEEFVEYLQGSVAWFNGQTNQAREAWEAILHHAKEDRHYRSTWAAFMLGRSWAGEDPEKAAAYFQQVRKLKTAGYADKVGLAAASLGEEARIRLRQSNAAEAMELYIQQLATGDGSAYSSLRYTCCDALTNDSATLIRLAGDPIERRVMTAYLVANLNQYSDDDHVEANRSRWLQAMEAANVTDSDCAEELALAAYQAGEWSMAQRWLDRASSTPTAEWLRAKLLLRDGKIDEAAKILDSLLEVFPEGDNGTNLAKPSGLQDSIEIEGSTYSTFYVSLHAEAQAESGALNLTRREYTESLDAFLHAGFWKDAAYVAERVLTLGELKEYVDQNWPAATNRASPLTKANAYIVNNMDNEIRYLLGRRLARARQWEMARPYYPRDQLTNYDELVSAVATAKNPETARDDRIYALLQASSLVRSNGMELLGYELEPDWEIEPGFGGLFDSLSERRAGTNDQIIRASDDELQRAQTGLDSRRFHYRFEAAELAMVAAKMMPDNTDEKAVVLCTAGSWLKNIDAKAADVYYKNLVRHCRKTAIGAQADRMRWFPDLDAEGNPVPWKPDPPKETDAPADTPAGGIWYALNRGNDLQDVADATANNHQHTITVAEIQEANPTINMNRLKAGLKIFVPAEKAVDATTR